MNQTQKLLPKSLVQDVIYPMHRLATPNWWRVWQPKASKLQTNGSGERSGITQRYWANDDQPVSVLAEFAARQV